MTVLKKWRGKKEKETHTQARSTSPYYKYRVTEVPQLSTKKKKNNKKEKKKRVNIHKFIAIYSWV